MEKVKECMECVSLKQEVLNLKKEISGLSLKLDRLLAAASHGTKEVACQSITSTNTAEAQTETGIIASQSIIPDIFDSTLLSTSYQDGVLMDIFLDTESRKNQTSSNPHQDTYSIPFIILPFVSIPNLPFSQFDFSQHNQETVFDTVLNNRSLAYFGEYSYSYNGIKHNPNPIPIADKYLCTRKTRKLIFVPISKFLQGN